MKEPLELELHLSSFVSPRNEVLAAGLECDSTVGKMTPIPHGPVEFTRLTGLYPRAIQMAHTSVGKYTNGFI